MIRFLKIAGVLFLCIAFFVAIQKIFFTDREVAKFIRGMNKTCPQMIDPETRLDKVLAFEKNNLQFNYTLIYQVRDSLPIPSLKNFMEPVILNKIKNSGTLRKFLDKDLTWIYSYNDRNGDFIFKVTYTPEQFR